jgi:hypothetical protein
VFAHKHAFALAHASEGGKCKRRVPYPEQSGGRAQRRSAQAKRGRLGCLLGAPGAELLRKAWLPYSCASAHRDYRVGVAGRERPAEVEAENADAIRELPPEAEVERDTPLVSPIALWKYDTYGIRLARCVTLCVNVGVHQDHDDRLALVVWKCLKKARPQSLRSGLLDAYKGASVTSVLACCSHAHVFKLVRECAVHKSAFCAPLHPKTLSGIPRHGTLRLPMTDDKLG